MAYIVHPICLRRILININTYRYVWSLEICVNLNLLSLLSVRNRPKVENSAYDSSKGIPAEERFSNKERLVSKEEPKVKSQTDLSSDCVTTEGNNKITDLPEETDSKTPPSPRPCVRPGLLTNSASLPSELSSSTKSMKSSSDISNHSILSKSKLFSKNIDQVGSPNMDVNNNNYVNTQSHSTSTSITRSIVLEKEYETMDRAEFNTKELYGKKLAEKDMEVSQISDSSSPPTKYVQSKDDQPSLSKPNPNPNFVDNKQYKPSPGMFGLGTSSGSDTNIPIKCPRESILLENVVPAGLQKHSLSKKKQKNQDHNKQSYSHYSGMPYVES